MRKRPTVYDVADRAGVSIATVSFSFRQPDRVKPATRSLVLKAASELGYVPSASARGLAAGKTGVLGIYAYEIFLEQADDASGVTADADEGDDASLRLFPLYVDEVQRGFELECRARGYAIMLGAASTHDSHAMTDIAGRVDGAAVLSRLLTKDVDLQTIGRVIPLVLVSQAANAQFDSLTVENEAGMQELTAHLLHVHGKRSLVFVGDVKAPEIAERYRGFVDALSSSGLQPQSAPLPFQGRKSPAEAAVVLGEWINRNGLPDAFVCGTDQGALAVLDVLRVLQIKVPEETAVTGFDGVIAGRISTPSLTTVRQPMELLGRRAAALLIERISTPEGQRVQESLPVRLWVRESCGCQ